METKQLSRRLSDIECICGFKSRKFTDVNFFFSLICGGILCVLFYLPLMFFQGKHWMVDMFFHGGDANRSSIPYYTVFLGCWVLATLLIKLQKLHVQRKALELLKNRLISAENQNISRNNQKFIALTAALDAMSPLKVLTRGYAVAENEDGTILRSVQQVKRGERITVSLSDGAITANVLEVKENGNESGK